MSDLNRHKCSVVDCFNSRGSCCFTLPKCQETKNEWIRFIFNDGLSRDNITTHLMVCSRHFTQESFMNFGQYQAGFATKLLLKNGAIPTLRVKTESDITFHQTSVVKHTSCQTDNPDRRTVGTQLSITTLKHPFRSTGSMAKLCCGDWGVGTGRGTLNPLKKLTKRPYLDLEEECSQSYSTSEPHHSVYSPAESATVMQHLEPLQRIPKYMVYESCLMELFEMCPVCQKVCEVHTRRLGTFLEVQQRCSQCQFSRQWRSQPVVDQSFSKILDSMDFSNRNEKSDPTRDELELTLSSDELLSDYESSEEEEKKKKKNNDSSDEWEPPTQEMTNDSENSEMSMDEEESDETDDLKNDGSRPVVICEECGSEARLQCSLLRHEKVFACPKCVSDDATEPRCIENLLVRFDDFKSFQVHAEKEHGVSTTRVLCQECGVFYLKPTETNGKKEHVCEYKTKHIVCPSCDKRFITEKGLKSHMRKLHGDMVHPCKYCLASFRNRPAKLQHEETHLKEEKMPYLCPDCPEKFNNIVQRNRHMRSHRGCWKTCGKGFIHLHRLERHELIHSGQKPFRCEVCDRSFTQEGHLKSHMRLHTGKKPYNCKLCSMSFNHNVSLKSHFLRYHSSETPPPEVSQENPKSRLSRKASGRPKGRPKRALEKEEQENKRQLELS